MPAKRRVQASRGLLRGLAEDQLFPKRAPKGKLERLTLITTLALEKGLPAGIVGERGSHSFEVVAGKERQVLGWTKVSYAEGTKIYHINSLMVHPDARRWGVAEAMLNHAIAAAERLGANKILASVQADNAAMLALMKKLMFNGKLVRARLKDESDHYIFTRML